MAQHQEVLDKLVLEELLFTDFGSDQLRDVKYSPDAYAQVRGPQPGHNGVEGWEDSTLLRGLHRG